MERVADDRAMASSDSPPDPPVGLRVREVLTAPCLAQARVLAGAAGLDRVVRRLNVMEVPDILPWVKPHELLLTTGYPLRHDPNALVDLVAELDERGLAAIAIKLHRYLDELPPSLLAEADRRGFPIIEFPQQVGFDDVLNEVLGTLLNRQAALAARSEEVHRALVSVVLEGGDLTDLATELSTILGGPVLITTPDGRVVARAGNPAELARIARGACFDPTGRFKVEREPAGARTDDPGPRAVVPIVAGRVDHGRIVTFSGNPLSEVDVHCLERAATVAALAITKRLAIAAVEGKYRADFLRDVVTGRIDDLPGAIAHARSLGWQLDRPTAVVVAELDPDEAPPLASGLELRPVQERFTAAWQTVMAVRDPHAAVVGFNREVVVLLGVGNGADVGRVVDDLDRQVSGDRGGGRHSFSLGVSRVVADPTGLQGAYEQARTAVRIGRRLHGVGARASFDRLGTYRLLALIPDGGELRGFVDEVLGQLAAETSDAADLRHTLEVLLDVNCNVAQAARRLHFHYNTLRYRIEKLEKMVGPFTREPSLRLDVALALRALQMRGG
jgi:purine catabolism regulator